MLVDDEPVAAQSLTRLLGGFGYSNIISASSGEGALEKIKEGIPALMIIDMKMPGMSGYELVGRLKEQVETRDIPILIMSGYAVETGKIEEYMQKKAIPIMSKPFDSEQVVRMVNYLL